MNIDIKELKIEVFNIKNLKVYEDEIQLLLSSLKESIARTINCIAYADSEILKQKFNNDLERYKKLEDKIEKQCKIEK